MPRFLLTITHRLSIQTQVTVTARSRSAAEERFGRMMDAGKLDGRINVETTGKLEVIWDGEGEVNIVQLPGNRNGRSPA